MSLAGDSALHEVESAVAAMEQSVDIQNAVAERNADVADDRRIPLRMAVNTVATAARIRLSL